MSDSASIKPLTDYNLFQSHMSKLDQFKNVDPKVRMSAIASLWSLKGWIIAHPENNVTLIVGPNAEENIVKLIAHHTVAAAEKEKIIQDEEKSSLTPLIVHNYVMRPPNVFDHLTEMVFEKMPTPQMRMNHVMSQIARGVDVAELWGDTEYENTDKPLKSKWAKLYIARVLFSQFDKQSKTASFPGIPGQPPIQNVPNVKAWLSLLQKKYNMDFDNIIYEEINKWEI